MAPYTPEVAAIMTPIAAVELRGVSRSFGAVRAVDGVDLRLELGEIAALLGPNGAGKTTTIDMILGLGRPDRGTVNVLGMSPAAAVSRGLIGAVLQTGGLLKDLTVRETLRLTASLYAQARPVEEVLERAGIVHIRDRLVGSCSGGEEQRLRFSLALLRDPALMALDEPSAGWTSRAAGTSGPRSGAMPNRAARSSSRRTTSRRPTPTPTESQTKADPPATRGRTAIAPEEI